MTTPQYKLVRDEIPGHHRAAGNILRIALIEKLHEETEELREAVGDEITEELADLLEVLLALAEFHKIDFRKVEAKRREKRERKGAFVKGVMQRVEPKVKA